MSAQKRYWLTAIVSAGGNPKITHGEKMWLKAYFDENPAACDLEEHMEGSGIRVPPEKASLTPIATSGTQRFDFELTAEEYNAGKFKVYFWGEPYGRVAFRKAGVQGDYAVGRLELEPKDCQKGGLPKPPPNSMLGDEQITCEFEAVQSVVNFIVDEINGNGVSPATKKMRDLNETAAKEPFYRAWAPRMVAADLLGCLTHSNETETSFDRAKTTVQELFFCRPGQRGGQWDHKPIIRPIWGAKNRLGNSGIIYFYDTWSNLHFGWIGAKGGFPLGTISSGAAGGQTIDNPKELGDDKADATAIEYGYNLGSSKLKISIQDIINIMNKHYDWDFCSRFPNDPSCKR